MKKIYYEPEYVSKFICDGPSCNAVCCKNWQIEIDAKAANRYRKFNSNIADFKNGHYYINFNEQNACPFLNEGYTEYLTQKYFTKKMKYTESEDFSVFFAKGIENIVGPEKMQECYFNANLGSLIEELEQYASKEDILKLLFLIDQEKTPFANRKNHRIIMRQIARMNARKLSQDLLSNRITKEQYDIEYAIKVEEYKKYSDFILEDQGRQSDLYEFTKSNEKPKYFEKKYQE